MNARTLAALGVPAGESTRLALGFVACYCRDGGYTALLADEIAAVVADPSSFLSDPTRGAFARSLYQPAFKQRESPAPTTR